MTPLPIILGTSLSAHVKAIAGYAHNFIPNDKRANVLLMGDLDTMEWHESFPLDLVFSYSDNKETPNASVISGGDDEQLPIADDSLDAVVIQFDGGHKDAIKEGFRILAKGGTLVVFDYINREIGKDASSWQGHKISGITELMASLPKGAILREYSVIRDSMLSASKAVTGDPQLSSIGCVLISITK